jgi:hypothetical protein
MIAPDTVNAEDNKGIRVRRPCRVYHLWPEGATYKSRPLNISPLSKDNREFSIYIQTFSNRPDFSAPAQPLNAALGSSHVLLNRTLGFWFGNVVVGARGEGPSIRGGSPIANVEMIPRHQGEIDVGVMFSNSQDGSTELVALSHELLEIALPFFSTLLDEHFVPIATTHIDEFGSGRKLNLPQRIYVKGKDRNRIAGSAANFLWLYQTVNLKTRSCPEK